MAVRVIATSIESVSKTAHDISATVSQRQQLAAQQAAAADETTAAMEKLAASTTHSAEQANDLAVGARQVLSLADEGARTVTQTLRSMNSLNEKVNAIARYVSPNAATQIAASRLVTEVASQPPARAQCAVEAARAGEQGRGFRSSPRKFEARRSYPYVRRQDHTLLMSSCKHRRYVKAAEEGTDVAGAYHREPHATASLCVTRSQGTEHPAHLDQRPPSSRSPSPTCCAR